MARLWGSGWELNTTTANVEWTSQSIGPQTTTVRSGTYAFRANAAGAGRSATFQFKASNTADGFYFRFYLRIAAAPDGTFDLFRASATGSADKVELRLNTDLTLDLFNAEDSAQIGSSSSALSTDTWYRIELKVDCTTIATTSVEARIDGTAFASGTINLAAGIIVCSIGANGTPTTDIYMDDFGVNDDNGSFQNTWLGIGEIIHLRPNAAGDNTGWNVGGATGTSFAEVDEVTPDDATTIIGETNGAPVLSDFNIDATPAALASNDTINCVQVGVRWLGETGTPARFRLRIKATSGGTVEETADITPTNTSYVTNATAAPRNHRLTLYDLPGASTTVWTKTELDTAQIGVNFSVDSDGEDIFVSTLWLLVDHTAVAAGSASASASASLSP